MAKVIPFSSSIGFADNFNTNLTFSFQTIYDQEMDGQPNSVREKIPFIVARKAMQEFQSRRIPVSPDSMQELCAKLQASEYPPALQKKMGIQMLRPRQKHLELLRLPYSTNFAAAIAR